MSPAGASAESSRRLAAIDVGTNSIRLIVAEAAPDGSYRVLDDEKAITRLGLGLDASGRLRPEPMEESALAIVRMKGIAEGYGVDAIRAIGTCAVREASNGPEFRRLVKERSGVTLVPISAEEEARLAFLSASHSFDLSSGGVAVVDIGGGSTEVVMASGGVVEQIYTLPLGAVRLTEQFAGAELPEHDEAFQRLRSSIRRALKKCIGRPPFVPQFMIGTGGTFTTLAGVSIHRGAHSGADSMLPFALRGHEMQRSEIKHLLEWLRKTPLKARARIPGFSPDRAEIIIAGAAIIEAVMKRLAVNTLRVHDRGIRDGLLLTMIGEIFPRAGLRPAEPADRLRAVRHFAAACRYEERHSVHVAELCVQIFDQLAGQRPEALRLCGGPAGRELLKAGALLHEVGYFINYSKHHKHAYHLIVHSDLSGFTHRELEIVANLARYHRRAEPKSSHPNFNKLSAPDRKLVRALSAILRVADGLDRTHTQSVLSFRLHADDHRAVFTLDAPDEPSVDIWGAERKAGLFAEEFGLEPSFQWAGPVPVNPNESPLDAEGWAAGSEGDGQNPVPAQRL